MPSDPTFTGVRIPYSDLSGELDPHKVYETRAKYLATRPKNGLERFAYMVFGPSLIGSLAFALNPYSAYEFPTMKITPINRTQKRLCIYQQTGAFHKTYTHQCICGNPPDGDPNFPQGHRGPYRCDCTTVPQTSGGGFTQPSYRGLISDTTIRTRPLNSKGGEFELFIPKLSAGGRTTMGTLDQTIVVSPNYPDPNYIQWSRQIYKRYSVASSPWGVYQTAEIDKLLTFERSMCNTTIVKHALGVLADSLPTSRAFNLSRSIAELKDLPMLYRNTLLLYKNDPSLRTAKGLGNQFLNYKFGWDLLVKDILDMLALPEKLTKEVNRLIDRNGMPTTFRAKRTGVDSVGASPVLSAYLLGEEILKSTGNYSSRKWQLRSAVTYTLKFPNVDVPILRQDLLDLKWGTDPTPADIYNLVPWTWLVDWFTGLGQYVDLMNQLANDNHLFNYGYLTYVSEGEYTNQWNIQRDSRRTYTTIDPASSSLEDTSIVSTWGASLSYKYQKRTDISTLSGVRAISRPSTLKAGQLAIIGALLAKFASS